MPPLICLEKFSNNNNSYLSSIPKYDQMNHLTRLKSVWKIGIKLPLFPIYKTALKRALSYFSYRMPQTLSKMLVCSRPGPTENVEIFTPTSSETRRT